jgi:FixJ family two-component response regulator
MKTPQGPEQPVVIVVDDDESLRDALGRLFRMVGLRTETFATAAEFFKRKLPDVATCLVLDIRLPGISGLELQVDLAKADVKVPIIFVTGHGDIPMSLKAMKAGACEFLPKPFRDQDMLDAVQLALERDRARRQAERTSLQNCGQIAIASGRASERS